MAITLLDTPGHVDFSAEMERTLKVLDYAVLVISGADGVQGHTRTLWRLLKLYQVPVFLFINKMDQPGADKEALYGKSRSIWTATALTLHRSETKASTKRRLCAKKQPWRNSYQRKSCIQ